MDHARGYVPKEKQKGVDTLRKNPFLKSTPESTEIGSGMGTRASLITIEMQRERRTARKMYDIEGDDDVVQF